MRRHLANILPPYIIAAVIILAAGFSQASAQRRITPVNTPATATQSVNENKLPSDSIDRSKLVQYRDDKGNVVLVDTITGIEIVDSAAMPKVPPMIYPLVYDASVGVNLWDPLMRAFGQSYGLIGFSAHFNMHNRYIAVFETGLGQADNTPADNNYTYHSGTAPFFKIGMDYNFMYNSNPDYQIYAGIRYGFSPFKWTLRGVTVDNGYWGESAEFNFPELNSTAGYLELLFGIKVKIYKAISMGWTFRYHNLLHYGPKTNGKPWYVPGYGATNSPIGASVSVYYTLPLHSRNKTGVMEPGPVIPPGETPPPPFTGDSTSSDNEAIDPNATETANEQDPVQ